MKITVFIETAFQLINLHQISLPRIIYARKSDENDVLLQLVAVIINAVQPYSYAA